MNLGSYISELPPQLNSQRIDSRWHLPTNHYFENSRHHFRLTLKPGRTGKSGTLSRSHLIRKVRCLSSICFSRSPALSGHFCDEITLTTSRDFYNLSRLWKFSQGRACGTPLECWDVGMKEYSNCDALRGSQDKLSGSKFFALVSYLFPYGRFPDKCLLWFGKESKTI
jgi:hypothetical protein